ncbi:preprotein translocase subunit SecA [Candidatus Falkowbacteria bacterium RBG_13_39_14]|uniref:Protein translocase subunit SecA n=1 Tax=Candidatus Falkowbacteria bacterium RBG_13_39_14 TaxID=1797985 RepID=A0A1F5S5E5_9BACT|nr:MAG: preprotein translocase subunit SecA [Candidatus Falkowbacteria bacterium RBG_13_39_14]
MKIFNKLFGDPNEKVIAGIRPIVEKINGLEPEFEKFSNEELKNKTEELKSRFHEDKERYADDVEKLEREIESTASQTERQKLKFKLLEKRNSAFDDILPEAFVLVREAGKRALGKDKARHFDVQLIGGVVLHRGQIAEMKTGEGKTLVATLPLFLNALEGHGCHLVTVNDYLSRVGAGWYAPIYDLLGISVGVIAHEKAYLYDKNHTDENQFDERLKNFKEVTRKEAYLADITYGTNNEFGFDYLRDNMVQSMEQKAQRPLHYAIVDEVDSILIDEARTPLIISAPREESSELYFKIDNMVKSLKEGKRVEKRQGIMAQLEKQSFDEDGDYNVDEKMRSVALTQEGIKKMEKMLGLDNIYTEGGIKLVHHIEQALKANVLFQRDKDYVVKDDEIIIVDEFTGRLMYGRRYSEGLHQAIEAKEGVKVQRESQTLATITFQNYFRLYQKLAGMTGTAVTEAEEFSKIYNLEVTVIPTNKPCVRADFNDSIYKSEEGKFKAVIREIKARQEKGQPVLVGTIAIEKNEYLSALLEREGIEHQVLNAKQHEREAQIIAQAGKIGAVTIATNMAGRGVDIILGGNPADQDEAKRVRKLGGLHIIGTERHESRRIDNQLRGRSGRQGDPGSSQFFVSMDDDLMRIFGSERMKSIMNKLGVPDDMPIENKIISKSIESAQTKVEGFHFDSRKHIVEYDDVMNKHREVIYRKRNEILEAADFPLSQRGIPVRRFGGKGDFSEVGGGNKGLTDEASSAHGKIPPSPQAGSTPFNKGGKPILRDIIFNMVEKEIEAVVFFHTASNDEKSWNMREIAEVANTIYPLTGNVMEELEKLNRTAGNKEDDAKARTRIIEYLLDGARKAYTALEEQIKEAGANMEDIEKGILLRSIDTLWVDHLDAMDYLRRSIGLKGYGQKDPLIEYKKEGRRMFMELLNMIQREVVYSIYKVGLATQIAPSVMQASNVSMSGATKTMQKGSGGLLKAAMAAMQGMAAMKKEAETGSRAGVVAEKAKNEEGEKVGRNDPCPCGSGKKFKKCCGR